MKKKLGQHFLKDEGIINKIIDSFDLSYHDTLVEIGPGNGALTDKLINLVEKFILIEYDEDLYKLLKSKYLFDSVDIHNADARIFDYSKVLDNGKPFIIVGNLPYYASNPIIRNILQSTHMPKKMIFMIQKEVAEQICAKEGNFSFLSAYINIFADAKKLFDVNPICFEPAPKVFSSVIEITPKIDEMFIDVDISNFIEFLTFGFKSPRKQIHNSLSDGLFLKLVETKKIIKSAKLDTTRRPSTLKMGEWKNLYDIWINLQSPRNAPGSIRRK